MLDQLCANRLANADLAGAAAAISRRERLLADVAIDASTGFELGDLHLMGSEVALATATSRRPAATPTPSPPCRSTAATPTSPLARRIKVDAMAGHLDDVAELGERFRQDWVRAGRPVASNLASAAGAVAMVHGLRGDDIERRRWRSITEALRAGQGRRRTSDLAWSHTFDALLVLDAGDPASALAIMNVDIDDDPQWRLWHQGMWRPWYAALWAEAAVLGCADDRADRVARAREATRDNPIALAIVERAAAIERGDLGRGQCIGNDVRSARLRLPARALAPTRRRHGDVAPRSHELTLAPSASSA